MTTQVSDRGRVLPPVYFLMTLIVMVCLHYLLPGTQLISSPFRYFGAILVAVAISFMLWAAVLFQKAGTTIKPFQKASTLIITGPYRVTRNPMYLAMVVTLFGVGILIGSAVPFIVVPVFAVLIELRFIRAEELALETTFGQAYREYKIKVRRWL